LSPLFRIIWSITFQVLWILFWLPSSILLYNSFFCDLIMEVSLFLENLYFPSLSLVLRCKYLFLHALCRLLVIHGFPIYLLFTLQLLIRQCLLYNSKNMKTKASSAWWGSSSCVFKVHLESLNSLRITKTGTWSLISVRNKPRVTWSFVIMWSISQWCQFINKRPETNSIQTITNINFTKVNIKVTINNKGFIFINFTKNNQLRCSWSGQCRLSE